MFKKSEYDRWMKQSRKTLKSAYNDLENEDYEWASFKAQQSAELAVKAILRGLGMGPIGHSITRLLKEFTNFNVEVPREILRCAMELDRNYIAPRYPDAYSEGAPFEYYSEEIARTLILYAEKIIRFVERVSKNVERT